MGVDCARNPDAAPSAAIGTRGVGEQGVAVPDEQATELTGYAVFLYPQAIESLGPAVNPVLRDSPSGKFLLCSRIDSGSPMFGMTLTGAGPHGKKRDLELMVPTAMVRLVMSVHDEHDIGFV